MILTIYGQWMLRANLLRIINTETITSSNLNTDNTDKRFVQITNEATYCLFVKYSIYSISFFVLALQLLNFY